MNKKNMREKRMQMKKHMQKVLFFLLCGILFWGFSPKAVYAENDNKLHVYYMYVGQGDGALIELNGKYMMIDSGPPQASSMVLEFLKSKGVTELEYVIASHPHPDHVGGFAEIVKEIKVKKLFATTQTPPMVGGYNYTQYLIYKNGIDAAGVQENTTFRGQTIPFGNATITFLAPARNYYQLLNDSSIVVKIQYGKNSFLFTGDAQAESENEMLAYNRTALKSDVLKVGHHSALTSTTLPFLEAVDPSFSVISCGLNNASKFPRWTTMNNLRFTNLFRTDLSGTVDISSDGTYISTDKPASNPARANSETGEMKNIYDTKVTSNDPRIKLVKKGEPVTYDLITEDTIDLEFSASFGVTEQVSIKYMLVEDGNSYTKGRWKVGTHATLDKNFKGNVFVRYQNSVGDILIRKTTGIAVDKNAVTSPKAYSNFKIAMIDGDKDSTKVIDVDQTLSISFDADFGPSGAKKVEYMLVEDGMPFSENGAWTAGNRVVIEGQFKGRIYVRFTDGLDHSAVYKTDILNVMPAPVTDTGIPEE